MDLTRAIPTSSPSSRTSMSAVSTHPSGFSIPLSASPFRFLAGLHMAGRSTLFQGFNGRTVDSGGAQGKYEDWAPSANDRDGIQLAEGAATLAW